MTSIYFNLYAIPVIVSFFITSFLALYLWIREYDQQTKYITLLMVTNAVYSFFYSIELSVSTLEDILLACKLEYFGISFLATYFLLFVFQFSDNGKWINKKSLTLLFFIPVITLLLALTNEYHHLFYKSTSLEYNNKFPVLHFVPAVWYWVHQTYVFVCMFFAIVILGKMVSNTAALYRRQVILILVGTSFPFLGYILYVIGLIPNGIDPVSSTFTLSGLFFFFTLVKFKLFKLAPVARAKLFERIPEAVVVINHDKKIVDFNNAAQSLFNFDSNAVGISIIDLLSQWPELMKKIHLKNFTENFEYIQFIDGEEHNFDVHFLQLTDSKERKQGQMLVLRDVSRLIHTERAHQQVSSRYDAIVHAIPDMMFVINGEGRFIDFFSPDHSQLYLPSKDVIGSSFNSLFPEDESKSNQIIIKECLKSGETKTLSYNLLLNNKTKYFEARLSRLNDHQVLAIVRDRTEYQEMKQSLDYQSGLRRILMNIASEFIHVSEQRTDKVVNESLASIGEYIQLNRIFIFEIESDKAIMNSTFEWSLSKINQRIKYHQNIPYVSNSEWAVSHQNGTYFIVKSLPELFANCKKCELHEYHYDNQPKSVLTIPITSDDRHFGFVGFENKDSDKTWEESELSLLQIYAGFLANLKVKNEMEKKLIIAKISAESASNIKTAFMNNISHEIRTPLNGILGFSEIIANETLSPDEKAHFLKVVQESSKRLMHTIDDYLDISLLVTGNQTRRNKLFRPVAIIEEIAREILPLMIEKNLLLRLDIPDELVDYTVNSDPELLRKVFNHVIDNALKFTKEGSVKIGAALKEKNIQFYVLDTGIGISKEAQKHIFESFMQEDYSATRRFEGSGLGLSIAKGIVELLEGEISLESDKGKGTTLKFSIPAE